MSIEDSKENAESILENVQRRITEAFDVFDHESSKTVDVREIGTIIRSLGCCPSEVDIHDILTEIEEEDSTGYIRFEKFLPLMTHVLIERRYRAAEMEKLLEAFKVLDTEGKGYLTKETITKRMTQEGETFSQEEMEEMLSAAIDPGKPQLNYKDYVNLMTVEDN